MEKEQINLGEMRKDLNNLKKQMKQMEESIAEDLEFAIKTELAWQSHDRGEFTSYSKSEFLEKLDKW